MCPEDEDELENSVDPVQTEGAVWPGSTLIAQTSLSKNIGSLPVAGKSHSSHQPFPQSVVLSHW